MGKGIGALIALVIILGAIIGGAMYFIQPQAMGGQEEEVVRVPTPSEDSRPVPAIQQELNDLSAKMVSQLKAEEQLNLNLVAQLRSYQEMLRQIEDYAADVERNLDIIEEISREEFQEDVKLQADLFAGKKPSLVAKHLEEFRAARVGAILSKMKDKEASAVLDIWAQQQNPKVSAFYREVMASYLNNKRRDANPELFNKVKPDRSAPELAESDQ